MKCKAKFFLENAGHSFKGADSTKSHIGHIFFEPTVDFRDIYRVNGGAVSTGSVLQLVVGENLLHGFGTGPAGIQRHNGV